MFGLSKIRIIASVCAIVCAPLWVANSDASTRVANEVCEQNLAPVLSSLFTFAPADVSQIPPSKFKGINIKLAKKIVPQQWAQNEQQYFSDIIDRLGALNLEHFFARIMQLGYARVLRLESHVEYVDGDFVPVRAWAGFSFAYEGLFISDSFFDPKHQSIAMPGGHIFQDYTVLHEFAHAFDGRRNLYSSSPTFLRLAGWVARDANAKVLEWVYTGATEQEAQDIHQRVKALLDDGQYAEAYELSQAWANARGMPTRYATTHPEETFAECVAYVALDPNVESYMNPELVRWIRENVLR